LQCPEATADEEYGCDDAFCECPENALDRSGLGSVLPIFEW